ncbi:hypothetical protein CLV58_109224 [Spirosoma oryzae]|uniref:Uncharacterized protein n=1 Tax=Spirosoma oryzae TaxID=1469603 RepID=A0A2T0SYL0_9BACT|nr:hypothetical protein CLV58_109224 [Spirosoma oryzae]
MNDTELVKTALQDWIKKNSPEARGRPYLTIKGKDNRSYTLNDILNEIENNTPFGREMVQGMVHLTIDLIARGKEVLP